MEGDGKGEPQKERGRKRKEKREIRLKQDESDRSRGINGSYLSLLPNASLRLVTWSTRFLTSREG